MRPIDCAADIEEGLAGLRRLDPRLVPVIDAAGPVPIRRREPGFEGLARIVVSQQISVSAAGAIWDRLARAVDPLTPEGLIAADPAALKAAGLSAPKIRTLTATAAAVVEGRLDLLHIAGLTPEEAHAVMCTLPGIGPWTADIFLLFCAGHPDIWPAGDLALQHAVRIAFGMDERPTEKPCRALAEIWRPWRGVAARLFWAYYAAVNRGRDAVPA